MDESLQIRLLGGFEVRIHGVDIPESEWRSKRVRSLVKLLALAPRQQLQRDQILDALWPDSDLGAAVNNLHQTLFSARKIFNSAGAHALTLVDGVLKLGEGVWVDVEQFETAATLARGSQDATLFRIALELYAGNLLPEDLYEDWTLARRKALIQVHYTLLLEQARLYEMRREYKAGIAAMSELLAEDDTNEEAGTLMMRLLALSGQRAQALRQFDLLKEALQRELAAEPGPAVRRLFEQIQSGRLQADLPPEPAPATPAHNLPSQLSSFIGREREVDEVAAQVRAQRLVTLTGTGGVGKTRLALHAGESLLSEFPDGVWLVELAGLSDAELIPLAWLQALGQVQPPGMSSEAALAGALKNWRALVILDNCEHLLAACTRLVDGLVKGCPQLHLLVTSREILAVRGESLFRVPSLSMPDPRAVPALEEIDRFEALRLFAERARLVQPGFQLTSENIHAATQICSRLDGIPLGIELAAARLRVLSVQQLAARLDNAFRILTGGSKAVLPRQQTMRAAVDWSYQLLTAQERLLLQRLSVFSGGWTLEAAEAVCPDPDGLMDCAGERLALEDVIDLLAKLADKSLLQVVQKVSGVRYHLLDTIRQYARERLVESGCEAGLRHRHLAYFACLSGDAEPNLRAKDQVMWLERLDLELENLLAAQGWSLSGQPELGLKIGADLMWFWHARALQKEAVERMCNLLSVEAQARGEQPLLGVRALQRARALRMLATIAGYSSLEDTGPDQMRWAQESVAILRDMRPLPRFELGIALMTLMGFDDSCYHDPSLHEETLGLLSTDKPNFYLSEYAFWRAGRATDFQTAFEFLEKSLALSRELGDWDGIISRGASFADMLAALGRYAEAHRVNEEVYEACQKLKNPWFIVLYHISLASIALRGGDASEAERLAHKGLAGLYRINYHVFLFLPLCVLQQAAWARGDPLLSIQYGLEIQERYGNAHPSSLVAVLYLTRAAMALKDLPQAAVFLRQAGASPFWNWSKTKPNTGMVNLLVWIRIFSCQGRSREAARLIGSVSEDYKKFCGGLNQRERSEYEEDCLAARLVLGEEGFQAAYASGLALSKEQALDWALDNLS